MASTSGTIVACAACGKRNRVAPRVGRARCAACHADLPRLVEADDATFEEVVVGSAMPVLVDIWAPWCGPCRAVSPVVEQLATEYAGRLKVAKVNADLSPQVSARHGVGSIPSLLLYTDGRETSRVVGARPAAELRAWVASSLEGSAREGS
jgi:thioredoxin 2